MAVFYGVVAGYALARCIINIEERDWRWAAMMGAGFVVVLAIAVDALHGVRS